MDRYPEQLPYNSKKYKSSSHIVLSHEAVEFVLNSPISKTIFDALHDYNSPEESFLQCCTSNKKVIFPEVCQLKMLLGAKTYQEPDL